MNFILHLFYIFVVSNALIGLFPHQEDAKGGRLDLIPLGEQNYHLITLSILVDPYSFVYANWQILTPDQLETILNLIPDEVLIEYADMKAASVLVYKILKNKLGEVNLYTISREIKGKLLDKILPVVLNNQDYFDDPLFRFHLKDKLYCVNLNRNHRGLLIKIDGNDHYDDEDKFKIVDELQLSYTSYLYLRRCLVPQDAKLDLNCKQIHDGKISCIILSNRILVE